MLKKKIAAVLVCALVVLLAACRMLKPVASMPDPEDETSAEETSAADGAQPEDRSDGEPEPESEADDFIFKKDRAAYLGAFESAIYGRLYVYYQDRRLIIFNAYGNRQFLISSHGYTPELLGDEEPELISDDMDFDGSADFGLLYSDTGLNCYYDCWLWNMEERTFEFSAPLAGIPSPTFDPVNETVYSYNRITEQNAIVTEYKWQSAGLLPVAHHASDNGSETMIAAPEDVDTPISIFDGIALSGVTLKGNVGSQSRWLVKIEDETIVKLYANEFNAVNAMCKFTFQGLRPGTTTVALKYAVSWESEAIADKALNITVLPDLTLRIIETER